MNYTEYKITLIGFSKRNYLSTRLDHGIFYIRKVEYYAYMALTRVKEIAIHHHQIKDLSY